MADSTIRLVSSAGGQWDWLTANPILFRRRAHGPGAPNFHYNILAAKSQEKNRIKNKKLFFTKPLDKCGRVCYNTYRKKERNEVNTMKYLIEARMVCEVKDTYREAEIFCAEHGIHPEEIVEITDEEAEEILG